MQFPMFLIYGFGTFPFLLVTLIAAYSEIKDIEKQIIALIAFFCYALFLIAVLIFFKPRNSGITFIIFTIIFILETLLIVFSYKVYRKIHNKRLGKKKKTGDKNTSNL